MGTRKKSERGREKVDLQMCSMKNVIVSYIEGEKQVKQNRHVLYKMK